MADPNDPYLIALPPVPCLTLHTPMDMKPDGYYERPVIPSCVVLHAGPDGAYCILRCLFYLFQRDVAAIAALALRKTVCKLFQDLS